MFQITVTIEINTFPMADQSPQWYVKEATCLVSWEKAMLSVKQDEDIVFPIIDEQILNEYKDHLVDISIINLYSLEHIDISFTSL